MRGEGAPLDAMSVEPLESLFECMLDLPEAGWKDILSLVRRLLLEEALEYSLRELEVNLVQDLLRLEGWPSASAFAENVNVALAKEEAWKLVRPAEPMEGRGSASAVPRSPESSCSLLRLMADFGRNSREALTGSGSV